MMFRFIARCDSMGRLVIPKPVRKHLGIDASTQIGIVLQASGEITLKPIPPTCIICDSEQEQDMHFWEERQVYLCSSCCERLETKLQQPLRRINAHKIFHSK